MLVSCGFSENKCKQLYEEVKNEQFDVIIVPGVPLKNGQWDTTMQGRVYWAKYLFDKGIAKNVMFSGSDVYTPYIEAQIMARYGMAIGIPKENIYVEKHAQHSTENIYYGYKKAQLLGLKKVALASDPYQTKMLRRFIRKKMDPRIPLIPIVESNLLEIEDKMYTPEIQYKDLFQEDFVSIKERVGFFKRLRGTMGNNIDTSLYNEKSDLDTVGQKWDNVPQ